MSVIIISEPSQSVVDDDYSKYENNFQNYCKRLIKVSNRNKIIRERLSIEPSPHASVAPESFDLLVKKHLDKERKKRSFVPGPSLLLPIEKKISLALNSCFMWYIMKGKGCRDVIPDYEKNYCREVFKKMIKASPKGEAHFGLGKLHFHDGNYQESLYHFNEALKHSDDMVYKIWYSFIILQCACNSKEEAVQILHKLESNKKVGYIKQEARIETYWALMTLSLTDLLKVRYEIELPHFYATKIKNIDVYYGYLAYSEIFLHDGQVQKAINVFTELINHNPTRPEAYMSMWKILYIQQKQYDMAEDLMTQAFIKINEAEYDAYITLFCLNLAKAYAKQKKFSYAFEILQQKFVEHPGSAVFLYQYGRFCIKAENYEYIGSAIGALNECLRLCDDKRYGKIYYWLGKAYLFNNQYFDSYLAIKSALERLGVSSHLKSAELRDILRQIKASISRAEMVHGMWLKGADPNKCLQECEEGTTHDVVRNIKAQCLWDIDQKENSVKFLFWCIQDNPNSLQCYFKLAEFLKKARKYEELKRLTKKMIKVSKNTNVNTSEWMNSNIWYARAQSLVGKPDKAIPLLQCLAKVFPPLSYWEIPYTKLLIKAKVANDFLLAAAKACKHQLYDFLSTTPVFINNHENTESSYEINDPLAINQRRDFTENYLEESCFDESILDNSVFLGDIDKYTNAHKSIDMTLSRLTDRGLTTFVTGNVPTGTGAFIGFSVCSEINFLYYLAKLCLQNQTKFEDGLCAIYDFLTLVNFEKDNKKKEKMRTKGLFLKGLLLIESQRGESGVKVLKNIRNELEKPEFKKKLEIAKKYTDDLL